MTNRIEIKSVVHKGERYSCVVKHAILMNGSSGARWLDAARDSRGTLVTDRALLDALENLI